jgi:hypothetical protein
MASLGRLERLDISVNPIRSVPPKTTSASPPSSFQRLKELVIKETTLNDEPIVLKSLKISSRIDVEEGVPERSSSDRHRLSGTRADRAGLIARFRGLEELNSSPVSNLSPIITLSMVVNPSSGSVR